MFVKFHVVITDFFKNNTKEYRSNSADSFWLKLIHWCLEKEILMSHKRISSMSLFGKGRGHLSEHLNPLYQGDQKLIE